MYSNIQDSHLLVAQLGIRARAAATKLTRLSTPRKSEAILAAASALRDEAAAILAA